MPTVTTVSLRAAPFIARQKPFVSEINVPKADFRLFEFAL